MNRPTLINTRVRNTTDARLIFNAVAHRKLPLLTRRLTVEERRAYIRTGAIFVWEERGPTSESSGAGIERWTDGKRWGPSRVRDEFLLYHEQPRNSNGSGTAYHRPHDHLVKQTYSVWVDPEGEEPRKWHLVAYFTTESIDRLGVVDRHPELCSIPQREFRSARTTRGRARGDDLLYDHELYATRTRDVMPVRLYPPYGFNLSFDHGLHYGNIDIRIHQTPSIPSPVSSVTASDHSSVDIARHLAPLKYLENMTPAPRAHLDDCAIRALDSTMQ